MQGSDRTGARRLRLPAGIVAAGALVLLAAACSGGASQASPASQASQARARARASAAAAARALRITPGNGTTGADPSAGVTVTADRGKLTKVTVRAAGQAVPGTLSGGGRVWHSRWALAPAQRYTVTASAAGTSDGTVSRTSRFRTLTPARRFTTEIFEGYGQTYGVGMPIMLTFSQPITDKAAVERSLQVATSKPVIGAWSWDGDEHLDFRPRDYWPAGTRVSFTGHLAGVEGAPGTYGTADLTQSFTIGTPVVAVASTTAHRTQIYVDGKLRYDWPISTGKPSTATPDGSYLTIEKHNPVRMTGGTKGRPGYYNELVPWSVRFTFSGDYYHDAYWSVAKQGSSNVSHGCVNLSAADAKTYYKMAVPGDPVSITGSPKAGKWDDGWTEWFLSFPQYVKGSALHEAVQAGPGGSRFVSLSALPPDTARAPLQTSAPGNWMAK